MSSFQLKAEQMW